MVIEQDYRPDLASAAQKTEYGKCMLVLYPEPQPETSHSESNLLVAKGVVSVLLLLFALGLFLGVRDGFGERGPASSIGYGIANGLFFLCGCPDWRDIGLDHHCSGSFCSCMIFCRDLA